jgi:hypothetical protein
MHPAVLLLTTLFLAALMDEFFEFMRFRWI